ncbi:MAG: hypothetical protein QM300_13890 [Pseudomonadota bacterium]|nr:hypothetical protein [Pseudomonadota bacterium]
MATYHKSFNQKGSNISPQSENSKPLAHPKEYAIPGDVWRSQANEFLRVSIENLLSGRHPEILHYLLEIRGFSKDTLDRHRIGYNPDDKSIERQDWGLPIVKDQDGREKKLWLPKGIVIPSFQDGVLQRIRIGSWGQGGDTKLKVKEYYIPGSSLAPVVIDAHKESTVVVLYDIDALILSQEVGDYVNIISLGHPRARPDKRALDMLAAAKGSVLFTLSGASEDVRSSLNWWKLNVDGVKRWPYPEKDEEEAEFRAGKMLKAWIMSGLGVPMGIRGKPQNQSPSTKIESNSKGKLQDSKYQYPDIFGDIQVYMARTREDAKLFFALTGYVRAKRYKAVFEPLVVSHGECAGLAVFFSGEARFVVRAAVVDNRYVMKGYGLTYGAPRKLVRFLREKAHKYGLELICDDQEKKVYLISGKEIQLDRPKALTWVVESMRNFVLEVGDYWI